MIRIKIDKNGMRTIADIALENIRTRTLQGVDMNGLPFRGYSTRPFAMPYAAVPKFVRNKLRAKRAIKKGTIEAPTFFRRGGLLWVVIPGGYKHYKSLRYPQDEGTVNLTATGRLLRNFRLLRARENEAVLGFTNDEMRKIASYHQITGIRGVKRQFIGLTNAEEAELAQEVLKIVSIDVI